MNRCDLRHDEPTGRVGNWCDRRATAFWSGDEPLGVRHAVEKMTTTLMHRDDASAPALVYRGRSSGNGDPRAVKLSLDAVVDGRYRYGLAIERTTPRRWTDESRFVAECERSFAYWCSKLEIARDELQRYPDGAAAIALRAAVERAIAIEEARAAVVEDPAPIAALQRMVLEALRAGQGFFTAGKEGGSHLGFDGRVFYRRDYGEQTSYETYDAAGMVDALRRFYDWDSRRDDYPHRPPEHAVWQYIKNQLRPR